MAADLAINVGFPPMRRDPVRYYEDVFDRMRADGVSVFRFLMTDFSFNCYAHGGRSFDRGMEALERVMAAARARGLRAIPVLFDFNELSHTNVEWSEYDHTFRSSFLSSVLARPMDLFAPEALELALGKFRRVREVVGGAAYAWELFNEVDQVDGFALPAVAAWARTFGAAVRQADGLPVYLSFANPGHVPAFRAAVPEVRVGIHVYGWPCRAFEENVVYWQSRFPECWVMEFGHPQATVPSLLAALSAGFLLNRERRVALPWYWDRVLELRAFHAFRPVLAFLEEHAGDGGFEFVGTLRREMPRPTAAALVSTFKLTGVRGVLSKARAVAAARLARPAAGAGRARRPGLAFRSATRLITLSTGGEPPDGDGDPGSRPLASLHAGGLTLAAHQPAG
ncbi:MAG TPA: hypothetical protein VF006_17635 [Longimicrobium sp.]